MYRNTHENVCQTLVGDKYIIYKYKHTCKKRYLQYGDAQNCFEGKTCMHMQNLMSMHPNAGITSIKREKVNDATKIQDY